MSFVCVGQMPFVSIRYIKYYLVVIHCKCTPSCEWENMKSTLPYLLWESDPSLRRKNVFVEN